MRSDVKLMLCRSVTCRLPQTPRTPSIAMGHYFDDIFQRSIDLGTPKSPGMRRIRRSSTARSIGARSDFDIPINGVDDDAASTTDSVYHDDPERIKEKEEADSHLHRYISEQLNRYKDENLKNMVDHQDEFEAKA